ncbi:hypothetical protein OJ253_2854 [Cryptosporidium canis]|uniref:Uncharacterized protein n=1 Tax=Cryptosporidium canis TaxID=195482 RepID=A0A9D5DEW9_9CRYT|nr:hypothetical protein OJ253_2854 [Cryptosporidium canis]
MIPALEEAVRHIEDNFADIVTLSDVDRSYTDRITANATINVQLNKTDSKELREKKVVIIEISQSGFRVLGREKSNTHETIEGLLLSLAPEAWTQYLETSIARKLGGGEEGISS